MSRQKTPAQMAKAIRGMGAMLEQKKTQFHREAAAIIRLERAKGFDRGQSPTGEGWKPLAHETIKRKRGEHSTQKMYRKQKGGPTGLSSRRAKPSATPEKPLIDTGALRMPTVEADAKSGRVVMAKSRSEMVSSAGSIGKIHNEGAGKVPKREHWGIYPEAIKQVTRLYNTTLKEVVRAASG
jgi:hypothetical protein